MESAMDMQERVEEVVRQRIPGRSRKAQEVREELAAHLLQSVHARQAEGLGEEDALERAVAELGAFRPLKRWLFWAALRANMLSLQALLAFLALCCIAVASVLPLAVISSIGYPFGGHHFPPAVIWIWQTGPAIPVYGGVALSCVCAFWHRRLARRMAWACCVVGAVQTAIWLVWFSGWDVPCWSTVLSLAASVVLAAASLWVGPRRREVRTHSVAE
jgi:hypothetical protein